LSRTRKIAAVAIGITALVPAAAQGATRNAFAGPPVKVKGLPAGADTNAFYRQKLTVHVGDTVKWKINQASTTPPATRSGSTASSGSRSTRRAPSAAARAAPAPPI
jgi:plastocyanin